MKYKQKEDISQLIPYTPWSSSHSAYMSLNLRHQRNAWKRRKNYTDILFNGSMKDIHSPNCIDSFSSSVHLRHDNHSSRRINSFKEQIDDYSMNMANSNNTKNKPISIVKRYEANDFLNVSPLNPIKNSQIAKKDKGNKVKENSFNILQADKEKAKKIKTKFFPQQKIKSFERTHSYNMLFYCNEIDHFKKGFLLYDE